MDHPGPFLWHTWAAILLSVVTSHLQGGKQWGANHVASPMLPGASLGLPAAVLPLSLPAPLRTLSLPLPGTASLSRPSFTGRAGRGPNCPKPHSFNPSKRGQTHFRPTVERKLRLSLEELPEASPGTQSFHQLRVEGAQT